MIAASGGYWVLIYWRPTLAEDSTGSSVRTLKHGALAEPGWSSVPAELSPAEVASGRRKLADLWLAIQLVNLEGEPGCSSCCQGWWFKYSFAVLCNFTWLSTFLKKIMPCTVFMDLKWTPKPFFVSGCKNVYSCCEVRHFNTSQRGNFAYFCTSISSDKKTLLLLLKKYQL